MLRDAWFIAVHDLRFMLRQRETLFWTFLIPPLFFYFLGTIAAGGGFGIGGGSGRVAVRLEADSGFLGDEIADRLGEQGFEVSRFDGEDRLVDAEGSPVSIDDPPGFSGFPRRLSVPAGFTASVLAGERVRLVFETDAGELAGQLDSFRLNRAVYTVLADVLAASGIATDAGAALADLGADDVAALRSAERTLTLDVSAAGRRIPNGFEQSVPGTMVMFTLLVLLTSGTVTLVIERRAGLLRRLASAPMRRGAVVLGKWGGKLGLAILQVGFAMLLGRFAFGVDWGPELPMLLLTLGAYMALIASLGILVGNLARTEGQAIAVGVLSANVLAALGGCWWPIEITPDYMQTLALFLPTGWMMDAMHRLVIFGHEWRAALPHLLGMSLGAWLLGIVSAKRFRFE